jgi:hypothetical protein
VSSGFGYEMHFDAEGKSVTKLDLSYKPPTAVEVQLDESTSLSITWEWTWSGMDEVTTETRLGQAAKMKVSFADEATLEQCLEYVGRLRNFFSLGVGRPVRVLSVTGVHVPPDDAEPGTWLSNSSSRVTCEHWRRTTVEALMRRTHATMSTMLERSTASGWRRSSGTATSRHSLIDSRKRSRGARKSPTGSSAAHAGRRSRSWGRSSSPGNYEVHLDPENEEHAASGAKLLVLVLQLRTLVEMTLLLDLGFSGEDVDSIFDRIRRYERVDHLKRAPKEEKEEVPA